MAFLSELSNLEIISVDVGVKILNISYPIFKALIKNKKIKNRQSILQFRRLCISGSTFRKKIFFISDDTPIELFYKYEERIDFLGKGTRSISSQNSNEKCEKKLKNTKK